MKHYLEITKEDVFLSKLSEKPITFWVFLSENKNAIIVHLKKHGLLTISHVHIKGSLYETNIISASCDMIIYIKNPKSVEYRSSIRTYTTIADSYLFDGSLDEIPSVTK